MLKKFVIPALILVAAVVLTIGMSKLRRSPEQSEPVEATLLVETITVSPVDTNITVVSQGTVEPRTRTNLVSEVAGQVIEVSPAFVAGGFFRKDDVLVRLDDQNYRAAVSRAEASVAAARSALEQERGQGDVAQREWDRMTAAQQNQVRARDLYLRKPQLAEAEARLASALADLEDARTDLVKTIVVAPYDGLVSSKNTDIGQYVNTGSVLAETFAVDYAEVRLPIPENKIAFLDLPPAIRNGAMNQGAGPLVELVSRLADREYTWEGHLTRTEGVLDTRTRVMFSVVQVEDPYGLYGAAREEPLRIGTYVNAAIQGRKLENVYLLPRHTLQANNLVWVADQENRLRSRDVIVVTTNGDNAFISAGLQPGDRVVITRMENPLPGMAVEVSNFYPAVD
jgi:RND family efflux transporter MFP subunit